MPSKSHASPPPSGNNSIGRIQLQKRPRSSLERSSITLVGALAYVFGVITGMLSRQSMTASLSVQWDSPVAQLCPPPSHMKRKKMNVTMQENRRIKEEQDQQWKERQGLEEQVQCIHQLRNQTVALEKQLEELREQIQNLQKASSIPTSNQKGNDDPMFPKTVNQLVVDYATVPRDDFNDLMDIGVPYDETTQGGGEDVLLLYTTPGAVPAVHSKINRSGLNATTAMENCNVVKVILQDRHDRRRMGVKQCIAIVPNWDSYYVHNFQRLPKQESEFNLPGEYLKAPGHVVDAKFPLRYTSRNHEDNGNYYEKVPRVEWFSRPFYRVLAGYLQNFDRVLDEVRTFIENNVTIADNMTATNKKQTLVVMTVNKGQSLLFHNFVCHSRKLGLDLSHIIMFATDKVALELCRDLGIPAFYDESIYGDFPEESAREYGDYTFGKMMLAKVICVHLVLYSNYNVLFEDVDVLWFKNPLEIFESPELEEWDMIFQDDGSRQTRFRPYSANSGFYFVRNNEITRFFFSTFLRMGDVIDSDHSHQSALTSLINEFASWKGLRVKVYPHGPNNPFPGGVEFHRPASWDLFRRMFQDNNTYPYIFHMSWTLNMDDKIKHYQQLGMWYLPNTTESCSGLDCCLEEPNFVCHYGDKPSMFPCPDAPVPVGYTGERFW
ncbi:nucleotide-diphospho-sugar transferase [Nitzschia inconspicua]|uniref:Nucleotide-diphospho-sugar transferase n=1 Tax=Nitzschia inconspicua TaxID=303405 RepID=A0A9K3KK08_9STRA|nr:nucleotide-diphospho-sugar transferase [Nitzschia inconspicua]